MTEEKKYPEELYILGTFGGQQGVHVIRYVEFADRYINKEGDVFVPSIYKSSLFNSSNTPKIALTLKKDDFNRENDLSFGDFFSGIFCSSNKISYQEPDNPAEEPKMFMYLPVYKEYKHAVAQLKRILEKSIIKDQELLDRCNEALSN